MPRLGSLLHLVRRGPRLVLGQAASSRPLRVHSCSINLLPARTLSSEPPEHQPESNEPWIPEYIEKFHEPLEDKRSRLMYQSRKRGMLENGLLLGILELTLPPYIHIITPSGSFAKKFLSEMDEEKLVLYDRLINLPSNDWEIYYWAVGQKETPEDFDNIVMDMLKQHAKNEHRESRITMPDLN